MPRIKMTAQWLEKIDPYAAAWQGEWTDAEERGLRLRVRSGILTWSTRYLAPDGSHPRFTIGEFPAIGLADARKEARKAKGRDDPQAERRAFREAAREGRKRRKLGETIAAAVRSWLADKKTGPASRWKGGLEGGSARCFLPHVNRLVNDLGDRLVTDLDPKDIEKFVSAPDAAGTRNHALSVVRTFLKWARRKHIIDRTAVDSLMGELVREPVVERDRTLTDHELGAFIRGFDSTRYGRAARMLALTGLRRGQVLEMEWSWIDNAAKAVNIPKRVDKSGKVRWEQLRAPLSRHAVALLAEQRAALLAEGIRSDFVFATITGKCPHRDALKPIMNRLRGRRSNGEPPSKDKRAKERTAVLPDDVTIHDVRRTVSDALLKRIGAAPWIVDHVVIGHVRPKLLRTYMPELPLAEARKALDAWGDILGRIVDAKPAAHAVS